MSIATLGGFSVTRARIQIPGWGLGWCDLSLADESELTGQQELVIGDRSFLVTVISGGSAEGRSSYRCAFGRGGWGKALSSNGYQDDAGVKLSTVLIDAARECGEELTEIPSTRLGPHYIRAAGSPASAMLNRHAPSGWYVRDDGVTVIGVRPTTTYAGEATRVRIDPAGAIFELATESLIGIDPGITVDGSLPASDVEIQLSDSRLTARVYCGRQLSRRLAAMARIFDSLDPNRKFAGIYGFRVVLQQGERLALQPLRISSGMHDLEHVPVRPGVSGCKATVLLGEPVLVGFEDRDPSMPQVIAHAAADDPGFMPLGIQFGESPALGVARVTDPVQAGPFSGAIVAGSLRVKASL